MLKPTSGIGWRTSRPGEVPMKIVLIPNPVLDGGPRPYVPLGILSLGTILRNDGFDVQILDVNEICEDATYRQMPEAIVACDPDIVGFSTWCNYYLDLIKVAGIVREKAPHAKIVFGGIQATHTDRETVEAFRQIDIVARGECDQTISGIVSSIHEPDKLRNVPGVTFMHRGDLIRTPDQGPVQDLDKLPMPDYSLLPFISKIDRVGIDVGRGCPFRCGYCVSNSLGKGRFRLRSVEKVVTIVKSLVEDYRKTWFRFEHDMLTLNRKWLLELCDALEREKLNITWECFSRVDTIDDGMIERMAAAGCNYIYFGIETGSPRMQKLLNKGLKLKQARSVLRKVCDAGITAVSGFIVGFPQERLADIAQTMRLALDLCFCSEQAVSRTFMWLLVPFAGSPLFEKFGSRLAIDEHISNFAVSIATSVDVEFAKKYPKVFSTFYYFVPEHVERNVFIRVAHLMINLIYLRYTGFVLLKDVRLGYPQSLLDHIGELQLPEGNIFHHAQTPESFAAVTDFISRTVKRLGFKDHYIHDLIKFDLAFHCADLEEKHTVSAITREFSHDVMGIVKEIKSNHFDRLPHDMPKQTCSVLFRKLLDGHVDCVRLPDIFSSAVSKLSSAASVS
jgi:radical SAM superfamily enzyme YgiQ (UPF0313 family)